MAIPTFVNTGSVATGAGALTLAPPSGLAVDDICYLCIESASADGVPAFSNEQTGSFDDWVEIFTQTVTGTRLTIYRAKVIATPVSNPTLADVGNHLLTRIIAVRGADTTTPNEAIDTLNDDYNTDATSDTSGAFPSHSTAGADRFIIGVACGDLPDATGTAEYNSWSFGNLASGTERTDNSTAAGTGADGGGSLAIITGTLATQGAIGSVTYTKANAATKVHAWIEVKPPGATAYELNVEPGAYSVSGAVAGVLEAAALNVAPGSYAVTGAVAGLARSFELNAEAGSYAVTGADAGLLETGVLNAEPGAYAVTGADAGLVVTGGLPDVMPESTGTLVQHVSPTAGNDTTGNGSLGSPWKTINKAWTHASLAGGGIIYLRGNDGEHGNGGGISGEATSITVTAKYGDSDDPITMETYPGDAQAVINGTRLHLNPGDLKQNDYNGGDGWNVRIRNIKFTGGSGFGLNGLEAIKSNNPRNFEISGCTFEWDSNSAILIRGMSREQALAEAISDTDTSFDLNGVANLLNATPFYMGITDISGTADWADVTEVVEVTNITSNTVTVNRGQLDTTAAAHASGVKVLGMWRADNVQIFGNVIHRAGMRGTRVNGTQSVGTGGTLTVDDTSAFPASGASPNGALVVEGVPVALNFTAKTATTFTLGTVTGGPYTFDDNAPVLNSWSSGHAHGIYYGSDAGADGGAIYNNLIYDCSAFGITLHEEANGTIVAYNTVDYCGRGGIDIAGENTHGTRNCIVTSNICTNNLQRAPIQGAGQSGWAINVWYASTGPIDPGTFNNTVDLTIHNGNDSGYHTSNTTDWPSGSVVFSNDIASDPLYTDQPNADYTLQSGSPAEGAGDPDFLPTVDVFGTTRSAADVGAVAASAVVYELNVEPGSYTLTGALAGALADRLVNAAAGAYSVLGADSGTAAHRVVNAEVGVYSLTGTPSGVIVARLVNAAAGAYLVTGADAELVKVGALEINLEPGVYTAIGTAFGIPAVRLFNVAAGSYALTGSVAGVVAGRTVNAASGAYTLTGAAAGLPAGRAVSVAAGSYAVTGADAELSSTTEVPVTAFFDRPSPNGAGDSGAPTSDQFDRHNPGKVIA